MSRLHKTFELSCRFNTCRSSTSIIETRITPQSAGGKNASKKVPKDETHQENSREKFKRANKESGLYQFKSGLFQSRGLLPAHDEIFWIHKRWKKCSGPAKSCLTNASDIGPDPDLLDPSIQQPKVIIIGAGMAGLSAGSRLAQSGFKNFQILEATDRLGGRVHSCWIGDGIAELGSLYLTRATVANPLYTLAAQEDLLRPQILWRNKPAVGATTFLTTEGRAMEPRLVSPVVKLFRGIADQARALFGYDTGRSQGSLKDFMQRRIDEEMKAVPEAWRSEALMLFWGLANEYKTRYGASVCKLSSSCFGSQVSLPGGSLRIPVGLLGVMGPLVKNINPNCIRVCTSVENISWQGGITRASVRTRNGEHIGADYVVVTVPLGILKERSKELFTPHLPTNKLGAISRLGWAVTNRFVLSYAQPFWLSGNGYYRFVWPEKDRNNSGSWIKGLSVLEEIPGSMNLLTFCLGDEEAKMAEVCSDESIIEEVTKTLRRCSGDPSLPSAQGVVRSKWGSDRNFLGSTSYLGVETSRDDPCQLALPLTEDRPVVLFAGEATAPGYVASLLGAHLSGVREAERILALTRRHGGPPPHKPC